MALDIPLLILLALVALAQYGLAQIFLADYVLKCSVTQLASYFLSIEAVTYFIHRVYVYPYLLSPLRHLPRAKGGYPLVGHAFSGFKRPRGDVFLRWMRDIPNDGLIYFRGLFNADRLVVTNHEALKELLVTKCYDFEKPAALRDFLRDVLGDGLIIVEGDGHAFLRRNLMPAFSFRHIKDLYPIFWRKATQMTEHVTEQLHEKPGQPVEVNHIANQVTVDIIGLAAMGSDFDCLRDGGRHPLIQNYEELLHPTTEKVLYFAARTFGPSELVKKLPWQLNNRMNAIVTNITSICLQLVQEKKQFIKAGDASLSDGADNRDILTLLIRSNNFSDQQMVDQMLTFLAAGHETTSSTFTWTAYLLATNPAIQSALRQELRDHLSASSESQTPESDLASILEGLPLLNGVCNEASRLYPTVPITVRIAVRDTSLLGQTVPKGTEILIVPWATNRNPELWGPSAAEFNPYRWIETDRNTGKQRPNNSGGAMSNYAFLTFLHGPRSCIGQGFARAELRCLVAAFVSSFEMSMADPNEKVIPHGVITTKPENGMHLRLHPLTG